MLLSLLSRFVQTHYALTGQWQVLPDERDLNYRLYTRSGEQFGIKLGNLTRTRQELTFRASMRRVLAEAALLIATPQNVVAANQHPYVEIADGADTRKLQVLTWVKGRPLSELTERPTLLLEEWGRVAGELSRALEGFDDGAAHYRCPRDPRHALMHRSSMHLLTAPQQALATDFFDLLVKADLAMLKDLRRSVCCANVHEDDLLVTERAEGGWRIAGLTDVGDAVYTYTITELAIACASAATDMPDPLGAMAAVVRGYAGINPLSETELLALYPLIIGRLLSTVMLAAQGRSEGITDALLAAREQRAWTVFERLRKLSPRLAHYVLRAAAGWAACPVAETFVRWLGGRPTLAPVVRWRGRELVALDFNVGADALPGARQAYADLDRLEEYVGELMSGTSPDAIGYGGYFETRPFYSSDLFREVGNEGPQWRSLHVGLDVWSPAGEDVYAPFPGRVHSFRQNDNARDYGATIVLEHRVAVPVLERGQPNRLRFWTLYGHLSKASIEELQVGKELPGGAAFAKTGAPDENGGWPPHLHFQVILDLVGHWGDFPGVVHPSERAVWASLCPDPSFLAGLARELVPSRRAAVL